MNEPEEEERCTKHKLILDAICLSCNSAKCCYKCFSVSNLHYNHNSLFLNEVDAISSSNNWEVIEESSNSSQYFSQNQMQQQQGMQKEKKKVFNRQIISRKNENSNLQFSNQMRDYRMQIDDLCKQITEQVWNYRQKFIKYMDSKLSEYNAFILVDQGQQITTEMISMRNELENFINSLKNQIKSIDSQNGQKQQLVPCNCSSAGVNYFTQNAKNFNQFSKNNTNVFNSMNSNNIGTDEDNSHSSPCCSCCSCNSFSSSSYTSSPSLSSHSYSSSSPYAQNTHQCLGGIYCPQYQYHQRQNEYNNSQQQTAYPNNNMNSNIIKQNQNQMNESVQHQLNCPNYHIQQRLNNNQRQTSIVAQQSTIVSTTQIAPKQISQIFIILTNGKSLPLQFNIYSSVLQIKILIFEKTGVPPLEQKLFFYTKELHNYTVMKDYSIPRDCSIKLYIRSFYSQLQSFSKKQQVCSTALPQSHSNINSQFNQQSNNFFNSIQQSSALPLQKPQQLYSNNMKNQQSPNYSFQAIPNSAFQTKAAFIDYEVEAEQSTLSLNQNMQQSIYSDKNRMQEDNYYDYQQSNENIFIYS